MRSKTYLEEGSTHRRAEERVGDEDAHEKGESDSDKPG